MTKRFFGGSRVFASLCILLGSSIASTGTQAYFNNASPLGTNTNEVLEYDSSVPYIDLFKASLPFREAAPHLTNSIPPYAVTMVVPLVDIDEQTGTTAIWEGSHKKSDDQNSEDRFRLLSRLMQEPDYSMAARPLPRQGDVYLMDYRVIHGGLANRSQIDRPILYVVYSRPWFRDGFNFGKQPSVSISSKQLKKVPKKFRGLFA